MSLDTSGFAAWLGSNRAHPLWQICGFAGLFAQGMRLMVPFQILDVRLFPKTGAGLCCPSVICSSWDAWHRDRSLWVDGREEESASVCHVI